MINQNIWLGLVNNASWLLGLFVIYDISYSLVNKNRALGQVINGLLIAGICVAVMALPFPLYSGIIFDARSILISITALIFGSIPAIITAAIGILYRIITGGAGTLAGIAAIVSSAVIGLAWKRWIYPQKKKSRWLNIYLMSLMVHLMMIADMMILPEQYRFDTICSIVMPVLLIYPIVSVLLSVLLFHQQERRQYEEGLRINEEKHRMIMENISDIIWIADLNLNTTYVSRSVEKFFGETPSEYMMNSSEDKFPPDSLHKLKALLAEELKLENDSNCHKDRTRVIELEHWKADGSAIWLSMHMSFLRDSKGNVIGFQGISRDISERKKSESALEEERRKAQLYVDIAPVIFIALDLKMRVTLINQEGCNILGISKDQVIGENWMDRFVPEKHKPLLEEMLKNILRGKSDSFKIHENSIMTKSGHERHISWRNTVLKDDMGQITGILSSGIDITDQTMALAALHESERSKGVLLENLPGVAYRCQYNKDWTMELVSGNCRELTGYDSCSLLRNRDLSFNELISQRYQEYLWDKWQQAVKSRTKFREEYEIVTASGETKWVWEQGQAVYDDNDNVVCLEGLIIDITDRKTNEMKLRYLSEHDMLTGLCNLRSLEETHFYQRSKNAEIKSAMILVNVRKFSVINRVFGYRFGDKLIQDIASCLSGSVSEEHLLFHISVDRFVFYVLQYQEKQDLENLCKKIIRILEAGIHQKTVSCNLGVFEIDRCVFDNVEGILKRAAIAAEHVNGHDRFGYCFFGREMEEKQQREIEIRQALTETLYQENDPSLFMLYQPIVSLKTNDIVGFEALARYKNDSLGIVSPAEFIPIAESSQLMLPLGKKIMRLVFDFAAHLWREGLGSCTVSFNISPVQLLSEPFLTDLENLITENGIDPQKLNIEITESAFSDSYQAINAKLEKVKAMGITISIDDFGTGYSSLARERELNVDCVKIDKYFIDSLLKTPYENAIIGDIISMVHKLGHYVVAEGVEQEQQKRYLTEHGCDMMQGYLFSRPVDEQAALNLLTENKNGCHSCDSPCKDGKDHERC